MNLVISFLAGLLIAGLPNLVFARIFFKVRHALPQTILRVLYTAELFKFVLTLLLFAGVWRFCTFEALPLFVGFIVGQFGVCGVTILLTNPCQRLKYSLL
jgi:F0F1-type ATP synthase assembly protein I